MSAENDDTKEFEASQKRLDEARTRGEVAKSQDLTASASFAGLALAVVLAGGSSMVGFGNAGMQLLGQADRIAPMMMSSGAAPIAVAVKGYLLASFPFFLAPAVAVCASLFLQGAFLFSPEKLAFKLSRISPLAAAKQKFGQEGIVEFFKNSAKMIVIAGALGFFLVNHAQEVLSSLYLQTATAMVVLLELFLNFLFLVVLISAAFGGADYLWQRAQHAQRNRMSRKEMMDETKDAEGDPHVKQQRRQRGQEIATNRMLSDVPTADVVIVNPTHYAVALKWDRANGGAPICVAKGVDEVAARIRETARDAKVPIHSDPPTARALYATVDLGAQILPEHYRAVAAAIRFAERMRKQARRPAAAR